MTSRAGKRFRRVAFAAIALAVIALAPIVARAGDFTVGKIHVVQPWTRATPKGASTGAGYMTITNTGTAPDRVSCVASDVSAQCQIHAMTVEDGVMKMRPVEGGLEIKPGETVTLKPGGMHVMFLGLKQPLQQGKTVKTTLKFENAGTLDLDLPVAAIGAPAPGMPAGGGTMMEGHGGMQMSPKH
jgi:copper(I)-binding protein